jgi:flagellar motor component MotA
MMLEGVLGILEGVNPRIIEEKLTGYLPHSERHAGAAAGGEAKLQADAAVGTTG